MHQLGCRAPCARRLQAAQRPGNYRHALSAARLAASAAGVHRHARRHLHHGVHAAGDIEPQSSPPPPAAQADTAGSPSSELLPAPAQCQQPDPPTADAAAVVSSPSSCNSSTNTAAAEAPSARRSSKPADVAEQSPAIAGQEYIMFTAEDLQGTAPTDADITQTPAVADTVPLSTAAPVETRESNDSLASSSSTSKGSSADVAAESTPSDNATTADAESSNTTAADADSSNTTAAGTNSTSTIAADVDSGGMTEQQQQQVEEKQLQLQHQHQQKEQETKQQQQLMAELLQQAEQQQSKPPPASWSSTKDTPIPPPLIDPTVDIANDPAYAIRLMDILDQVSVSSLGSSNTSSMQPVEAVAESKQQSTDARYKFVRQPASFCTNCCTPLDPLRPAAACSSCGHLPSNNALLFSHGVSSLNELTTHSPPWLQQQQAAAAAAAAGQGSESGLQDSMAALSQRIEAGIAVQQARKLLQDAGILQLPTTLLAWEDDQTDPEPAMQMHRSLLPPNHERPERMRVVLARLRAAGLLDVCTHLQPREATDEELLAVHTPGLIAAVAALSHANQPSDLNQVAAHLAPDMLGNRYTYRAARTAAGTAAELAEQLVTGRASNGMAIIRPMGHTAGVDSGEAGNYFNNAAVAVRAALRAGARRVMVIDWDVHHSKGTSEIFAEDPSVLVFSLHKYGSGFYPGSGAAEHVGVGRGRGRNINVAWCPPTITDKRGRRIQVEAPPISDGDYLTAWNMLVLPVAAEFRPHVILVSAGFDAADKDPLGHYRLHPELFGHLTALLRPIAPLGLLLEGGYNLSVTAACTEACVRALVGERPASLRGTRCAGVTGWASILRTLLVQQEHWQCLGMLNFLQLATPVAEDWEAQDETDEDEEDGGYEVGDEEEEEQEQELPEEELNEVLAAAAAGKTAGKSVDDFEPEEVVAAISEAPDLLQQVLDLLDQKIAASQVKQLEEQLKAAALEAAAATEQQQQQQQQQAEGASKAGRWSAGGFMDDVESVDSGSDDESAYKQLLGAGRTDWGLEQIDEDANEHMAWYGAKDTEKQLMDAQEAAAAAAQAAAGAVASDWDPAAVAAAEAAAPTAYMAEPGVVSVVAEANVALADTAAAGTEGKTALSAAADTSVQESNAERADMPQQHMQTTAAVAKTMEAEEAAAAIAAVAAEDVMTDVAGITASIPEAASAEAVPAAVAAATKQQGGAAACADQASEAAATGTAATTVQAYPVTPDVAPAAPEPTTAVSAVETSTAEVDMVDVSTSEVE